MGKALQTDPWLSDLCISSWGTEGRLLPLHGEHSALHILLPGVSAHSGQCSAPWQRDMSARAAIDFIYEVLYDNSILGLEKWYRDLGACLDVSDPDSIPSITYGPPEPPAVTPEHSARTKPRVQLGVAQSQK